MRSIGVNHMELIERYLYEVGRYLPRKKRDDVLAELRSAIMDSLDARTEGQPSEDTIISVLKEFGPPRGVAASYAPAHQYVIGPALYPTFITVLKVGVVALTIVQAVALAFALARGDALAALPGLPGSIVQSAFSFVGSTMIVFAILERFGVQPEQKAEEWDPRTLPALPRGAEVNRGEMAAEVALTLIALGLLTVYGDRLEALVNPARPGPFILADPALRPYVLWGSVLMVLDAILSLYLLYQGVWSLVTRGLKIGLNFVWIVLLVQIANLDWGAILVRTWGSDGLAPVGDMLRFPIYFVIVMIGIDIAKQAYQQVRGGLSPSGSGETLAPKMG